MKTIGVIGGLGPQATYDFEERVHRVSNELIPSNGNEGYPPMVVFYYREAPVLMADAITPVMPMEVNPKLLEIAGNLGRLADFIVITSNGVHAMQQMIEQASGKKVLSMIDATLAEVARRNPRKVGVLEFVGSGIYQRPLAEKGTPHVTIDKDLQHELDLKIHDVWEGKQDAKSEAVLRKAIDRLKQQGADLVILGCTELPLMLGNKADAPDLINPAQLLAEAAVRHAIED